MAARGVLDPVVAHGPRPAQHRPRHSRVVGMGKSAVLDLGAPGPVSVEIGDQEPGGAGDPYNLGRFVQAQEQNYDQALAEIKRGRKQSHWMWYIFPQFDGLGFSSTSKRYAIKSVAEATAYLSHPVLGPRL